jgi:hypothetical protein
VTFAFCQPARSSRSTTAIFVSNCTLAYYIRRRRTYPDELTRALASYRYPND